MVVRSVEAGRLELNLAKRSGVAALTDRYLPSEQPLPSLSSAVIPLRLERTFHRLVEVEKPDQNWIRLIARLRNFSCQTRATTAAQRFIFDGVRRAATGDVHQTNVSRGTLNRSLRELGSRSRDSRRCKCESFARFQRKRQARKKPRRDAGLSGAEGGTRTHTLLRAADFESAASTVPPLRRGREV